MSWFTSNRSRPWIAAVSIFSGVLFGGVLLGCGSADDDSISDNTPADDAEDSQSETGSFEDAATQTTTSTVPAPSSEASETDTSTSKPDTPVESATTSTTSPTTTSVPAVPAVPRPEASTLDELLELGRPLVIAHAGGDQDYPHSTLYAYTQSARVGADVLELDVQLTADGVLIVQHDDTVDRTTETRGAVNEFTLEEIKALDNAYWFAPGYWGDQTRPVEEYHFRGVRTGDVAPPAGFTRDDFAVATFREVAERFADYVLDVEIKIQRGPDGEDDPQTGIAAAEVLAAEISELGRQQSVVVASFNDEVLAAFQQLAPDVAVSPGYDDMLGWYLADAPLNPEYRVLQVPKVFEGAEVITPELLQKVHDEGRYAWVWLSGTDTVETRDFYADLLQRGVDGIIAGRPAEAISAQVPD